MGVLKHGKVALQVAHVKDHSGIRMGFASNPYPPVRT
jgi:hypothetical protein